MNHLVGLALCPRSNVNHTAWCAAPYGIRYDLCSRFSNSISLQTAEVHMNAFINGIDQLGAKPAQTVHYKNILYICQLVVFLKGCGDEYGSIHTQGILLQADDADDRLIRCISMLGFGMPLEPSVYCICCCTSDIRGDTSNTRQSRFVLD